MNGNIERRISKGNLSQFLFSHPLYYSSMADHKITDTRYFDLVNKVLPENWQITHKKLWYFIAPADYQMIPHGFKIHISLVSAITPQVLEKIVPVLVRHQTAFKMLADPKLQDFHNSQACNRVSSGKFITVYPATLPTFKQILQDLYEVTGNDYGPFILSDKPYKDSRCLFYRYGAFLGTEQKDVMGENRPVVINEQTGETDIRMPYFLLPEGIADPFGEDVEYPDELLHGRYEVTECLSSHSSKGGVYLATDSSSGKTVILKEARPFINQKNNKDAISGIMHEEEVLRRLQKTGITPAVVDSFNEWQHRFLVLEYIPWSTLTYADRQYHSKICKNDPDSVKGFCQWYLTLLKNIISAVKNIHQQGIVIGDLAPQNILYDKNTLTVRMIDFEGAYDQVTERFYAPISSRGFTTQKESKPEFVDDWAALSAIAIHLLHPVCSLFVLVPEARDAFIAELINHYGLPTEFCRLYSAITEGAEAAEKQISRLTTIYSGLSSENYLYDRQQENDSNKKITAGQLDQLLTGINSYLKSFIEQPVERTFPMDYRVLNTNTINIAYGKSGIYYSLYKAGMLPANKLASFISHDLQQETLENLPPGLYMGLSGVAWLLYEMGAVSEAEKLMEKTCQLPTLKEGSDLFYGAAGWGMASLFFYQQTGLCSYLDKAIEAGRVIQGNLKTLADLPYYENIDGHSYSGLLHGSAGVALFYLRLFQASGNQSCLNAAKELLRAEWQRAEYVHDNIVWRKDYAEETTYPYFRFGSAGIGMVAIRFYVALHETDYLQLAEKIAAALKDKFCVYPGLFVGMAGLGEFFLDLYAVTNKTEYLDEARHIARRISLYQYQDDRGITFPGEELARLSADYGTGAAGIGLFFQRLLNHGQGKQLFLDFEALKPVITD